MGKSEIKKKNEGKLGERGEKENEKVEGIAERERGNNAEEGNQKRQRRLEKRRRNERKVELGATDNHLSKVEPIMIFR